MSHSRMRLAAIGTLALLTGCATYARSQGMLAPGIGVTDELISAGCESRAEYDELLAEAKTYRERAQFIPRSGWSACRVLATIGAPHENTWIDVQGSRAMQWTYWESAPAPSFGEAMMGAKSGGKVPRLVTIEPTEEHPRGEVTSVVW